MYIYIHVHACTCIITCVGTCIWPVHLTSTTDHFDNVSQIGIQYLRTMYIYTCVHLLYMYLLKNDIRVWGDSYTCMKERDRERRGKKEGTCTHRSSIKQCLVTVRARGGGEGEREREREGGE